MNCNTCEKPIIENTLLCPDCNTFNTSYVFTEDSIRIDYSNKMKSLEDVVNQPIDLEDYRWDPVVAEYAGKIEKAKKLLEFGDVETFVTRKLKSDLDSFLDRSKNAEFHIALVGAIKAGKSTLINALLGSDLASTRVTPETASLTKFRKSSNGKDYVKVSFYSKGEWEKLWESVIDSKAKVFLEEYEVLEAEKIKHEWLDRQSFTQACTSLEELKTEIHKWTSSKQATHYFVKEVEVGLAQLELPEGVILVDTPGLDDVVAYRSDITRDYIDRANAVLVCVKSDALTGPEMATIYSVFANARYNPEKIYVIATQLDTLNHPVRDWEEQRLEWLKYLVDEGAYGSRDLAEKNLIPVSGYLYSLIKSRAEIEENSDQDFDFASTVMKFRIHPNDIEKNIDFLNDLTGIKTLSTKLETDVISNHKALLIKDIRENYAICQEELLKLADEIEKDQIEIIELTEKGIDEIKERQKEQEMEVEQLAVEKAQLEETLHKIETQAKEEGRQLATRIRGMGMKS
ncbi:dynamin family protein [Exiguobacterium indicum]|uniref:Dynamin family protein n=1 Tax=Exiguobacterium indicum TaxID=296995 RepID=A0ABU8ELT3_9BACL